MTTINQKLQELGVTLPALTPPVANYVPFVISGSLLYISGQIPTKDGAVAFKGHLGGDVSLEQGQDAAKLCAINILAQAKAALGDLGRITQLVKLSGFVASKPDFTDHPKVINGASDLMVAVFGDAGKHARVAMGVAALPLGSAVEVDAIFEIKN